ncbi:MAG: hypothetical protein BWZ10_02652 [candidate division BRC1 bacterium ADurb.BinA364]|nr:MAG: hypothetical protein BWZ10_02652 [candidate division BRC1 bacterium ADurb.BinA364]
MLDQWEQWFSAMDESGIAVFFLLYDDGVKRFESGDVPPPEEELFVRALVERFKHHRNWIWCVAEESEEAFSMPRARAIAALIAKYDDRGHVIANHHHNGVVFKSYEDGCALTQFAIQFTGTVEEMHAGVLEAWRGAAGRYNLNMAEPHTPGRLAAWASAMAGAHFMELDMDIASTPPQRLDECRTQQRFFESTDFNTMAPRDELARGGTKWVLADPGRSYIAYAERLEGAMGLAGMAAGEYDLRWVDCVSGAIAEQTANVEQAGEGSFPRPESIGPECAVWVRLKGASAGATAAGDILEAKDGDAPLRALDRRIAVRAGRESPIQLDYRGGGGPGPYVYTVTRPPAHGTLAGRNNDLIYKADPDYEGADSFQWIVNDGQADSNAATVSIEVRK